MLTGTIISGTFLGWTPGGSVAIALSVTGTRTEATPGSAEEVRTEEVRTGGSASLAPRPVSPVSTGGRS